MTRPGEATDLKVLKWRRGTVYPTFFSSPKATKSLFLVKPQDLSLSYI